MNATGTGNAAGAFTGGIPLNVTLHAWPVPKLQTEQKQLNQTDVINVRNSESAKNLTTKFSHTLNATGYVAPDEGVTDTGFTDVQTLILAGIATLIPLLIAVATILGVRFLWRRYRERKGEGYEGVLQREESSDPLGKVQGHSLPQELKTSESQFTVTPGEEPNSSSSPQVLTPKSNGSVITMTLKNNHLIVETEETSDSLEGIKIESKGTTTKYVTPTVPDFRGDVTTSRTPDYSKDQQSETSSPEHDGESKVSSSTDHGALVHQPPEEIEEGFDQRSCNTGLSQSDLSMSSSGSQNPSYRYGNQSGYDSGGYGYPEYAGYSTLVDSHKKRASSGPKENKAYVRSPSLLERTDSVVSNIEITGPLLKDVLMSDIQARESRTKEVDDDERYQEEQRALGNGDLSPKKKSDAQVGDEDSKRRSSDAMMNDASSLKDKKRSSLPNFAPLATGKGSRFEQLKNEMSPLEEIERYPLNVVKDGTKTNSNS